MIRLAEFLEKLIRKVFSYTMWCYALLVLLIVSQVICRYIFNFTSSVFEELQWYLFAVSFLSGIAYCIVVDSHVRADVLYAKFPENVRRFIDLLVMVLFVMPIFSYLFIQSLPFVERAFAVSESSPNPGGLPFLWLLKASIPLACVLVVAAAFSRSVKLFFQKNESVDHG